MSPTLQLDTTDHQRAFVPLQTGQQITCFVCAQLCWNPVMCAACGAYGHTHCIGLERLFTNAGTYILCKGCFQDAKQQFDMLQDQRARQEWLDIANERISGWKKDDNGCGWNWC